ncbi:MAG: hypothetical protein QG608_2060 [Actinomycetota bacterium]|nr:hypothetical protein [Actinomycetota bacterium]
MILITGGTGTTGRLIARELAHRGRRVRTAARGAGADIPFDWYDPKTHLPALRGTRALYVVAPTGLLDPSPVVLPFLELARRSGVHRAVLLGSSAVPAGEHGLGLVQTCLGDIFSEWAVLRPSWFMENFVGNHPHARNIRERGEIVSATGNGRVGFIDPLDIAETAVRALTDPVPHNTDHVLTGPESLSYDDVAAVLCEVGGRPVRHRAVGEGELVGLLEMAGMPGGYARFLAALDVGIAQGAEDRTTPVVQEVTGRPPRAFREFCRGRFPGQ